MKTKILLCAILCSTVHLFAQGNFVYVNDDTSPNTVSAFRVNADGGLALIGDSPFLTGGSGGGFNIDPGKITIATIAGTAFLYAANTGDGTVTSFRIDPQTGSLVPGVVTPIGSPLSDTSLVASPGGRFLFAADGATPVVHVFSISSPMGALNEVSGSPFNVGGASRVLHVSSNGRFLVVGLISINAVEIFSIGGEGILTEAGSPVPTSGIPFAAEINCHSNRLFVSNAGVTGTSLIDSFHMTGNGSLIPSSGSPFPSGAVGIVSALALDPSDRFLIVSNTFQRSVSTFTVRPNGALYSVPASPVAADDFVGRIAFTSSGNFVYVSLFATAAVDGWSISPLGDLTPVPGHRFSTGQSPRGQSSLVVFPMPFCTK